MNINIHVWVCVDLNFEHIQQLTDKGLPILNENSIFILVYQKDIMKSRQPIAIMNFYPVKSY